MSCIYSFLVNADSGYTEGEIDASGWSERVEKAKATSADLVERSDLAPFHDELQQLDTEVAAIPAAPVAHERVASEVLQRPDAPFREYCLENRTELAITAEWGG